MHSWLGVCLKCRQRGAPLCTAYSWGRDGATAPRRRVQSVVVEDVRFWYSAFVAAHAILKRISQNDDATIVFRECFRAGRCDMKNWSASLARP